MAEIQEEKKASKNLIGNTIWVLKLNLKHARFLFITRLAGFINNQCYPIARSFVMGLIIDWGIKYTADDAHDSKYIYYSMLAFGALYFVNGTINVLNNYGENVGRFKLNYLIPETLLYRKLNALSNADLESPKVQNMVSRYRDNRYIISNLSQNLLRITAILVVFSITAVPLFTVLPIVTILLIFTSIPGLFANKRAINKLWDLDKETTVENRKAWSMVYQISSPETLKEVRLVGAFDYIKKFFEDYIELFNNKRKEIYTVWSVFDVISTILTGGTILFGIYQLIELVNTGNITIGQVTFFIGALLNLGGNIDSFSAQITDISASSIRLTEIRELLEMPEEDDENKKDIALLSEPPSLEIKDLTFSYPGAKAKVLKNLNLKIKPGEKIAIVGENGAGKTTLIKLLTKIYPVSKGEILINDENLNGISTSSWNNSLGVLFQDYNTYPDLTAFENIAIGRMTDEIDYEKITDAAKKADAHDFIMAYENNYSQILSEKYEGGIRPSGGQWQKISIARFFYRNAPILILDEPTASIDAVSEANIFNRIYKFIENKTVIIVSHRFSTVRNADRIIVLDKGEIVEDGSHEELMKNKGKYYEAFTLQAKGYN